MKAESARRIRVLRRLTKLLVGDVVLLFLVGGAILFKLGDQDLIASLGVFFAIAAVVGGLLMPLAQMWLSIEEADRLKETQGEGETVIVVEGAHGPTSIRISAHGPAVTILVGVNGTDGANGWESQPSVTPRSGGALHSLCTLPARSARLLCKVFGGG